LSNIVNKNAFGRLLKLWRNTRNISQEELSLEVGVSGRHISFLETGRSNPGRELILKIATFFKLSPRDLNNLLVAAGFTQSESHEEETTLPSHVRKTLQLSLSSLDPTPAIANDPYGNAIMVNKAWVKIHQRCDKAFIENNLNIYHCYFSEKGLQPFLVGWEGTACSLLMNLQQEILLTNDERATAILEELLSYPSTPKNWRQLSDEFGYQNSFRVDIETADHSEIEKLICVNHTVGATPFISDPRIILSSFHRIDGQPIIGSDTDIDVTHPLLYNSKKFATH
jgi:transcriptional regulator with XRE-family HTH domain